MAKAASGYSIQRRSDGRWSVGITIKGERVYLYGKTKAEVQSKLKQKLWEIEQAKATNLINYAQSDKITVIQWGKECLETYCRGSVKANTYGNYLYVLENHLDGIGDMKLNIVTNVVVQKHLNDKVRSCTNPNGVGKSTLQKIKAFLNIIFKYAVANGFVLRNPVTGVKVPNIEASETRALTVEEEHALLDAARASNILMHFAVVFALYTGCRKGEVLGLQWKHVDLESCKLQVCQQLNRHYNMDPNGKQNSVLELITPKSKHSIRTVCFCKSFCKEFKEYKRRLIAWKLEKGFPHSEDDLVFVNSKNGPLEPRRFYKLYMELLESVGIEDATFHTLRHTYTTRCIEKGMDVLMLSKTLGHANVSVTLDKYAHLMPKHMELSVEKLEENYY